MQGAQAEAEHYDLGDQGEDSFDTELFDYADGEDTQVDPEEYLEGFDVDLLNPDYSEPPQNDGDVTHDDAPSSPGAGSAASASPTRWRPSA